MRGWDGYEINDMSCDGEELVLLQGCSTQDLMLKLSNQVTGRIY